MAMEDVSVDEDGHRSLLSLEVDAYCSARVTFSSKLQGGLERWRRKYRRKHRK